MGLLKIYLSKDKAFYITIKNILGFYPKNIFVYKLAFLHRSVGKRMPDGFRLDNERLEYLGDAVLSTVIADYLYKRYPQAKEGFLTEMRSKIVSRNSLNMIANKLNLHDFIAIENKKCNYKSLDGNVLEALIGAVFIDKGFNFVKKVIVNQIVDLHLDMNEIENKKWNYKSKLIDQMQKSKKSIAFSVTDVIGKGYQKQYVVVVVIDDAEIATGQGYSIKSAEQEASEKAYKILFNE